MVFAVSARAARRGAAGTGRFVSAAEISLSTWLFRADPDADAAVSARRAAVAPVVNAAFSDERAARRRARVFRRDPRRSGRSALPIGAVQRVESRMAQRLSARAAFQGRHGRGQPAACPIAWEVLRGCADFFISFPDYAAAKGMRILSSPLPGDERIISGESGASAFGCVMEILSNPALSSLREELGIDSNSRLLFISTEGATDRENYRAIVWDGKYPSF